MIGSLNATPMIAVKNIDAAKNFYAEKLGVDVEPISDSEMAHCHSGATDFMLYKSQYAGTNKANALAWSVGDRFDAIIKELKSKGVKFEIYDNLPDTEVKGDIHVSGSFKMAWFKDPDGNILHINNGD